MAFLERIFGDRVAADTLAQEAAKAAERLREKGIDIEDSFLIKTLVHNFSHDPETLEKFFIKDTVSTHYANIHGSPSDGSFLGPFATVDLTTMYDCVIGTYSYIQVGEISHLKIGPGTVWVRSPGEFNFLYRFPLNKLNYYINQSTHHH